MAPDDQSSALVHADDTLITRSVQMKELLSLTDRVARTNASVLLLGETGSGKELIAQALHRRSDRCAAPLRVVNCAALPDALIESLLFGHERGAFTGAGQSAVGVFEQARGGTAFLDEVGELSLRAQAVLLRFLETRVLTRIGAPHDIGVDVRVVAATHRNLEDMVRTKRFRSDLLYRLNTVTLRVAPLRDRLMEIEPLCRLFVRRACAAWHLPLAEFSPSAMRTLENYHWPGNVRELRNVVEQAVILADGPRIGAEQLPDHVLNAAGSSETRISARAAAPDEPCYRERVRRYEASIIADALKRCRGNRSRAARELRIPLRTLVTKIRSFGVKS